MTPLANSVLSLFSFSFHKIHEDEGLNSKIYEGFQKYQFDKSSKVFVADATANGEELKKRYFVSLMSESLIKKGVFFRLRKRVRVSLLFFLCIFFITFFHSFFYLKFSRIQD